MKNYWYLKIGKAFELKERKERILYRIFEIIPGAITWLTLGLLALFSFIYPFFIAIFIIVFDLYWLIRIVYFYFHLGAAFKITKEIQEIDWFEKLKSENLDFKKIYHLVILPFYKESEELIKGTIKALADSNYPVKERMIVILAAEERAGEKARIIAKNIENLYKDKFFKFLVTIHPENLPGELAGKGANTAWAGRKAKELIDQLKINYEDIIVSSFDIDTVVPENYFSRLTYVFLKTEDRLHASYQPVPIYLNNIWDAPFLSRLVAFSTTFWALLNQERPKKLKTFSSHSMPFKAIVDVDFWKTDIVTEDNMIFFQCFLRYDGNYRVIPLFYPVYMDANVGENFFKTIINVYKQHRRWGWGVETIPYMLYGFLKNKAVPLRKKITQVFEYLESFWSWATSSLIIAIFGWFPLVVGSENFRKSLFALNLPAISGRILNIAMIALIFSAFFSLGLSAFKQTKVSKSKILWAIFQWILTPLIIILFITIPALDAQTRLMLGKYMGFWVTPKVRKKLG